MIAHRPDRHGGRDVAFPVAGELRILETFVEELEHDLCDLRVGADVGELLANICAHLPDGARQLLERVFLLIKVDEDTSHRELYGRDARRLLERGVVLPVIHERDEDLERLEHHFARPVVHRLRV